MLDILRRVEEVLPELLLDEAGWETLFVDYHPPYVERLWRPWFGYRVYLHRIHPCSVAEALFHPHPWPSAMRIVSGTYEMAVGFGEGEKVPPTAARIILSTGSEYEMTHPDGWHYVRPLGRPALSLMVTGTPWDRSSPKSEKALSPLTTAKRDEILKFFREYYSGSAGR